MCVTILSIYQSDKLQVCEKLNLHYMNKFYKYFDNIPFSHFLLLYLFHTLFILSFIEIEKHTYLNYLHEMINFMDVSNL